MAYNRFLLTSAFMIFAFAVPAAAAPSKSATATASITVLQRVSAQVSTNLSAGGVKTVGKGKGKQDDDNQGNQNGQGNQGNQNNQGNGKDKDKDKGATVDLTGTVVVPATYPLNAKPQPTYTNAVASQGSGSAVPSAARIDITGSPNTTFSIVVQGWTQVSGMAGAGVQAGSTTFYSPTNTPNTVARGVFNSQGKASVYIGATVVVPLDPSGSIYSFKPLFVASYN